MDDVETYGNVFHRYNFGDAIKDNVISNYQIIIRLIASECFQSFNR